MRVKVHFFGNFRSIAERSEQYFELPENSTVRRLLDNLIAQYSKMESILSQSKIKKSHVLIVRGEKPVPNNKTKLKDGDQLYLFIMLTGG